MKRTIKRIAAVLMAGTMLTAICASAAEPRYKVNTWRWPEAKAVMYFEDLEVNSRNQANYAASDWNKQLTDMFKFMKSSTNTTNRVIYSNITGTHEDALAVTHTFHTTKPGADGWEHITKAPIEINTKYQWDTSSNTCASGKYHLRSVLRHEYGHAIGIAHSELNSACMYPTISSGKVKNLTSDDIQAGEAIYEDFARNLNEYAQKNDLNVSEINEVDEVDILYPEYTPVELVNNASNIVTGVVESIEPNYSDGNSVYSKVNISINDNLKGNINDTTISIPMFGGTKDQVVYMYNDAPTYTLGEEVILYLNDLDVEEDNWYLPVNYTASLDLNKMSTAKSVDKQTIIDQVKEDIEEAKTVQNVIEEGMDVGEPVEDIMLDEE